MTVSISDVLTSSARSMHDNIPHAQAVPFPTASGTVVDPAGWSRIEKQNSNHHRLHMPHFRSSEQNKAPYGPLGSQPPTTNSQPVEEHAFHGVGAQFHGQQLSPNGPDLTNNTLSGAHQHRCHQTSLHRLQMSRGVVQGPGYSNSRPLERFLQETPAQQPPFLAEPSSGRVSTGERCCHRSSTSAK